MGDVIQNFAPLGSFTILQNGRYWLHRKPPSNEYQSHPRALRGDAHVIEQHIRQPETRSPSSEPSPKRGRGLGMKPVRRGRKSNPGNGLLLRGAGISRKEPGVAWSSCFSADEEGCWGFGSPPRPLTAILNRWLRWTRGDQEGTMRTPLRQTTAGTPIHAGLGRQLPHGL